MPFQKLHLYFPLWGFSLMISCCEAKKTTPGGCLHFPTNEAIANNMKVEREKFFFSKQNFTNKKELELLVRISIQRSGAPIFALWQKPPLPLRFRLSASRMQYSANGLHSTSFFV